MNTLYYGDNLKILREYIKDESVDLIYLDPPFNSNRNYNVLFRDESGSEAESQITAFEDTWHWNHSAEQTFHELINTPDEVGRMIESFQQFIGKNQMMAYLVMMAVRLKELHRVLKPTGSLYLHCDPTASHYLKILLDAIFEVQNYRSEIVWKRSHAHSSAKRYGPIHDTIFFYSKSDEYLWTDPRQPYDQTYINTYFKYDDHDGRGVYWTGDLTGSGIRNGETGDTWRGVNPTEKGRHWMYPPSKLDELDADGRIYFGKKEGGMPKLKRYLKEQKGVALQDFWYDLSGLSQMGGDKDERLGYPTQKPVALLERIVSASSNQGDVVLDPFCGCGTTIAAAQKLNREWIGIDITHLSVGLQKLRLKDSFNLTAGKDYKVIGQPEDLEGAKELAQNDRYGFQWWILPLIGARALGAEKGSKEGKKGSDKGIDGIMVFTDDNSGKAKRVVVSVKSGHVNVTHIRDLAHVIEREKAAIGVYLTLEPATKPMIEEAVGAGFYHSPGWNKDYPKIQILTVEELLAGKSVQLPPNLQTFKQAEKIGGKADDQGSLGFD